MQEELSKKLRLSDKNEAGYFEKPSEFDFSKFTNFNLAVPELLTYVGLPKKKCLRYVFCINELILYIKFLSMHFVRYKHMKQ